MAEPTTQNVGAIRRWGWLVAPVLAAIFPVLSLYAEAADEANPSDLVISGLVVALGAVAAATLFRWWFQNSSRASLATITFVVWFFSYAAYMRFGRYVMETIAVSHLTDYFLLAVYLLLLVATIAILRKLRLRERTLDHFLEFVTLACAFTVSLVAFHAVRGYLQANHFDRGAKSIWAIDEPIVPADWKPQTPPSGRNFYYLVFDRYANSKTLQKYFGFDNSKFYTELEKRGFVVDRNALTSYPMTAPQMSSVLNMRYLSATFGSIADYFPPLQEHRVGKLFQTAGYKFLYYGNLYAPLRSSRIADWNMRVSFMPCEFADSMVALTPLRPLIGRAYKYRLTMSKFAQVAESAESSDLKFVYAHFLVPHPPYAFAADGSALSEWNRETQREQELYIGQLIATNRLMLQLIDKILANSDTKPVIILQADEGPYLMAGDASLTREDKIEKRTGILNAFYIPDADIRAKLPQTLAPVNTFRFLLKEYFGAPIELLPNRVFFWQEAEATGIAMPGTQIVDVTDEFRGDSPAASQ